MKEYRIKKKLLRILLCMALVLGGFLPTGILETVAAENGSGTCTITGSIIWDDNDDQDGKRPESVEVKLFAYGVYKPNNYCDSRRGLGI